MKSKSSRPAEGARLVHDLPAATGLETAFRRSSRSSIDVHRVEVRAVTGEISVG